jgi:hypothetical protein
VAGLVALDELTWIGKTRLAPILLGLAVTVGLLAGSVLLYYREQGGDRPFHEFMNIVFDYISRADKGETEDPDLYRLRKQAQAAQIDLPRAIEDADDPA